MGIRNRPLKILHVVEHGITLNSGYGFRSLNIFWSQSKRGWQPVVLTFPEPHERDKGYWRQPETLRTIRYYYRPLSEQRRLFPFFVFRRRMASLAKRIGEIAALEKPDLLHAHSPVLNGATALKVGRRLGIPLVYEIRSLWEEAAVAHGTYGYHSYQFKRIRTLESRICRNADQVVTISNGLKNHLVGRGIPSDKISIVSNGVELDTFTTCEPDAEYQRIWKLAGKEIVAYIGSFRRYEGLDLLIKAFAYLSKTRPESVLLLVGGGRLEAESELKALVDRLDLREKVVMPGWLPPERIPGVYALTDVLVYPRTRIPLTEIVTPLKPLEAMAMGKSLIASDIGGHRELIRPGYNGLLFPAGSEAALAEAIARLLDDHGLRRRLGEQGAIWVSRERSWSKTTSLYAEIYGKALRASSSCHTSETGIT
jgi:PEP-CTERM/exosortase A-associated glycosyltransferase